ncbi:hypothetical protein HYT45_03620 [Candidatus Uhrbacteria bacterium]|nr:hypothetical protein [Candidatus Uhrbacteria bacterium]
MNKFRRASAWLIAGGGAIIGLAVRGGIVATVAYLGFWSFPIYLVADSASALAVGWLYGEGSHKENWLERKLGISEANLKHGSLLIRGFTYLALLSLGIICGPPFVATLIRSMGFKSREAYWRILSVAVPVSLICTSAYLGLIEVIKKFFVL